MAARKPTNPFYVASLPIGVLFGLTACAYVVMTMRGIDPQRAEETGLVRLMERHGVFIMMIELAALAVLTVAAIFSDDFWVRRFQATEREKGKKEKLP
jgi:formate-dependent nitrite reductase membrane component NrfD